MEGGAPRDSTIRFSIIVHEFLKKLTMAEATLELEDLSLLLMDSDSSDLSTSSESTAIPVVQDEWEEHPVIVLWREWNGSKKVEKANFDFQAHKDKMSSFINGILEEPSCLDVFVTGREWLSASAHACIS